MLENNINTAVDLSFIANITTRLLQSIQFQILSVSFLELCYYIHKLFILTNGFSALPTGPQVTDAYNLFHNINNPPTQPNLPNNPPVNMAASANEMKTIFQNIFGIDPG